MRDEPHPSLGPDERLISFCHLFSLAIAVLLVLVRPFLAVAQTAPELTFGFSRIIPGWTNYHTAFSATHELTANGDWSTVASFYTPPLDVMPREFGAIMVWYDYGGQRFAFANYSFQVFFWSSLEAFIRDPRQGDLATLNFSAPTSGTNTPDTITVGGRNAYHLRFELSHASLVLTQCQMYLVGIAALGNPSRDGELYVPTAPHEGPSDLGAGSFIPFGWTYLISVGGTTIYCGQLATELKVAPLGELPRLDLARNSDEVCLSWPGSAACYTLETAESLVTPDWQPAGEMPVLSEARQSLCFQATNSMRWFRLVKFNDSVSPP